MTGRNRTIAALAAFVAGSAAALWVLWGPMFRHVSGGGSVELCLKDYYAPDQYAVLSIARLAQDGLPVYREPYSATGESYYPSEYYRVLGGTADLTGTSVVWAWNVVGLIVSVALIALAVVWARRLAPGTRAWVLAPLPFLVGTLYWWDSGGWLYQSGEAVLWPPVASLYSPGSEDPAIVFAGVSLIVIVAALAARGRRAAVLAGVSGVAAGLSLHLHANVAIFCVVATALLLLYDELLTASVRRRAATAGGAVILLVAGAVLPASGLTSWLSLLLLATAAAALSDADWRRHRGVTVAAWVAGAVVASLPLSVRLIAETLSEDGYFHDRQASVASAQVDLPLLALLALMLPLWVLVLAVGRRLARDGDRAHPGWLPLLAGLASATLILTAAGHLGVEGLEWHRFLIYGAVLTTMAAAPGLWLLLAHERDRRELAAGVVVALALVATLPATIAFVGDQRDAVVCTPPQERDAFVEIGRVAGDRLLLVDRCFLPGPLRLFSGARIATFNAGIAVPPDREDTASANDTISRGHLPKADVLRRAGVTGFLTNTQCAGVAPEEIAGRLGTPYARVPLRNGEALGLPPGLVYELYDVPPTATAAATPGRAGAG